MNLSRLRRSVVAVIAAGLTFCAARSVWAQLGVSEQPADRGFSIVGAFDQSAGDEPATVSARFTAATGKGPGRLMVTVRLDPGWHVYSITQPRGGPQPTKIQLAPSPKYRLLAPFRAHPAPTTRIDTEIWIGLELEEHEEEVTWYAPIELAAGVDPASLVIRGKVDMLVCNEQCIPIKAPFAARLGQSIAGLPVREEASRLPAAIAPFTGPTSRGVYRARGSEVEISGRLEPATVRPGETARLLMTATPSPDWHVYAYADQDPGQGTKPTLIALESTWGLTVHSPATDSPIEIDDSVPEFGVMRYHEGAVTWATEIVVPADAEPGEYPIAGMVGYQACESRPDGGGVCEMPQAVRFRAALRVVEPASPVASGAGGTAAPLTFAAGRYNDAAKLAAWQAGAIRDGGAATSTPPVNSLVQSTSPGNTGGPAGDGEAGASVESDGTAAAAATPYDLKRIEIQESTGSLLEYMVLAFVGGLILNLMPCVLPVIGLKVMSFVEQAGKSRWHALGLNLWYAAGIIAVFVLLGVLAAAIGLTWGGQFGNTAFNVTIAAVVFAMALALLGVWEIPIPGFFGSGAVQEAAAKEGPLGAFLKGVVTTVLATPCTAPFMATAIAWAVSESTTTTLIVFSSLGLGMASPYLVVGVFPELLRFLPKPGGWMLTFKQITGFILLGTVVFILSFIEPAAVVPTVLLLVGIGMACWLVARTPLTAAISDRMQSWAMAVAVMLLFGVASFGWLYPDVMRPRFGERYVSSAKEGWLPFSLTRLQEVAVEEGRTVLVDFSADWCFNCIALEKTVLHTEPVEQAIADDGVVTLYADFTHYPQEIDDTLKALESNGVPVIAIFPGSTPYQPIVFRGGYSKPKLIAALDRAKARSGQAERPKVAEVTAASASPN